MGNLRTSDVVLRNVIDDDIAIFFEQQQDADARWMAAFTVEDPTDWSAFTVKWIGIRARTTGAAKTIVHGGSVAGYVLSFIAAWSGQHEIGYWIGREHWGSGVATRALAAFLGEVAKRPLYARAAADNVGSIRVLEKCGFVLVGRERSFANARGAEIEEVVMELRFQR